MRVIDLFAGVGGWSQGARAAGHQVIAAVEYDELAAEWYARNHGDHVICADITTLDPHDFKRPDILLASPPCPNFSIAKAGGEETEQDIALAHKVAEFILVLDPQYVLLENVYQYRKSQSWAIIQNVLNRAGYWTQVHHLNSADYGVPQTRKRMIARAGKGFLPPLPPKKPWIGWYKAIEDLLDELPNSQFANWQLERLPDDFEEFLLGAGTRSEPVAAGDPAQTVTSNHNQLAAVKAFLVSGQNGSGQSSLQRDVTLRKATDPTFTVNASAWKSMPTAFVMDSQNSRGGTRPSVRMGAEPIVTVTAQATKGQARAWHDRSRVVSMTPRALARFQSFPDSYQFPETATHATRLIGNAVPPLMAEALLKDLPDA